VGGIVSGGVASGYAPSGLARKAQHDFTAFEAIPRMKPPTLHEVPTWFPSDRLDSAEGASSHGKELYGTRVLEANPSGRTSRLSGRTAGAGTRVAHALFVGQHHFSQALGSTAQEWQANFVGSEDAELLEQRLGV
jgi:hypothetical protein